jgi:hypothetical protein
VSALMLLGIWEGITSNGLGQVLMLAPKPFKS